MKTFLILLNLISISIFLFLLHSCANQKPPTGGPKDEIPPHLISSIPLPNSTNFQSNTIELVFDEAIDGRNVKGDLIITPRTEIDFSVKSRRNKVTVTLLDTLPSNRTFTFDFQQSIIDLTEKNETDPIKIAFSTGDNIDTLSIYGTVKDLLTELPVEGVNVMLYDPNDTLTIEEGEPLYIAKTDSSGIFSIDNLGTGIDYEIYALSEKDDDYDYTKRDEKIGFYPEYVSLADSNLNLDFKIIDYDNQEFEFQRIENKDQYIEVLFNKKPVRYQLIYADEKWEDSIFHQIEESHLKLYSVMKDTTLKDSIPLIIELYDSVDNVVRDTSNILFDYSKPETPPNLSIKSNSPKETKLIPDKNYDVVINFNKPIISYSLDSLQLLQVKPDTTDTLSITEGLWNYSRDELTIPNLSTNNAMTILMKAGAFVSVQNDTSKKKELKYTLKDPEQFGIINLLVKTELDSFFIVQLLGSDYKVEQEIKNLKEVTFEYVTPGEKYVRVLIDENKDGIWSKGSYQQKVMPERLYFLESPIEMKENWELGGFEIEIPNNE